VGASELCYIVFLVLTFVIGVVVSFMCLICLVMFEEFF